MLTNQYAIVENTVAKNNEMPLINDRRDYHKPRSVEDLTQRNIETILQLEEAAKENRSLADRVADGISGFCGTMPFLWIHLIWFGGWIILNLLPGIKHFDPFPFQFLTLVVSLEAIFLSTFILISQNRESRLTDRRNHLNLQIDLLSEQENTKMLKMIEKISNKLGIEDDPDPDVAILTEATKPDRLIDQIEERIKQEKNGNLQNGHHRAP